MQLQQKWSTVRGTCSENLCLALGSSRCLQCSNSYLSLLAAFAFSGFALVLLLLVLKLTVAAGTINGLIFYANVLAVNSALFFQPQSTNVPKVLIAKVLKVFIAWVLKFVSVTEWMPMSKHGCSLHSPSMCGFW